MQTQRQTQARIKNAQRALAKANANGPMLAARRSLFAVRMFVHRLPPGAMADLRSGMMMANALSRTVQYPLYGWTGAGTAVHCPLSIHLAGKHLHWPFSVNIDRFPCKFNTQTFRDPGPSQIENLICAKWLRLEVREGAAGRVHRWAAQVTRCLHLSLAHFELSLKLRQPIGWAINYCLTSPSFFPSVRPPFSPTMPRTTSSPAL